VAPEDLAPTERGDGEPHCPWRAPVQGEGQRVGPGPRSSRFNRAITPAPRLPVNPFHPASRRSTRLWGQLSLARSGGGLPQARLWIVRLLAVCCVGLVPWTIGLALSLPRSYLIGDWPVAWVGFDVVLLGCLGTTAWGLWRRRLVAIPASLFTAALLLCDAWFDVVTAHGGPCLAVSAATALLAEIPIAILLGLTSIRLLYATGFDQRSRGNGPHDRRWVSSSSHMRAVGARKSCERSLPLRMSVATRHP
jgi:hypothetical protein